MTVQKRLISRVWTAGVLVILLIGVATFLAMALALGGTGRVVGVAGLAFFGLHLVAAVRAFVLPRRRRELVDDATGTTTIEAPGSLVWPLVAAWGAFPLVALVLVVQAIVNFDSIESPGAVFVVVIASVAGLPDWLRLVTGRLRRWRVVLTRESLIYQGYRTDLEVPWSKIHGATVQRTKPVGVLIDLKGTRPDPVIPYPAFDLPIDQIVEEIEKRLRAWR